MITAIEISDIAAIGALISSALIFWFGYSRSRKSEQIEIARELIDRIDEKGTKLTEVQSPSGEDSRTVEEQTEVVKTIGELSRELEYFSYLVRIHEIRDENTLRYYIPRLDDWFALAEIHLLTIRKPVTESIVDRQLNALNEIKNSIMPWLDKYSSRKGKEEEGTKGIGENR